MVAIQIAAIFLYFFYRRAVLIMYNDFMGSNPYQIRLNHMQNQMQNPQGMQMQPPAPHYEIVQVNGEAGANMLPVGPRSSILALDQSRSDVLLAWFIQTDDAGYKTKTPYVLTPYVAENPTRNLEERITRLERIINEQSVTANVEQSSTTTATASREPVADAPTV